MDAVADLAQARELVGLIRAVAGDAVGVDVGPVLVQFGEQRDQRVDLPLVGGHERPHQRQ
ncbi:MAG: hypothetical protein QOJ89_3248, partial [bacterium]